MISQKTIEQLGSDFKGKSYSDFKKALAADLIDYLEPLRRKRKEMLTREIYVADILNRGAARAQTIASETMRDVKKSMGLA